ncbi:MAG: hypothetical protein WCF84_01200 [Anaerolineae bacterium]
MRACRILILCEPGLLAQGLRLLLEADSRIEVVGVVEEGQRLAEALRQVLPDVLLVQQDRVSLMIGDPPEALPLDRAPFVVLLGQNANTMRICRIEERALTDPAELVEALAAL